MPQWVRLSEWLGLSVYFYQKRAMVTGSVPHRPTAEVNLPYSWYPRLWKKTVVNVMPLHFVAMLKE